MTDTVPAAAIGLPTVTHPNVYPRFTQADSMPGLASQAMCLNVRHFDPAEQARAMNAILAELNAILATGGARA